MKGTIGNWPCKGCSERFPACHGSCRRYQEAKAEQDVGIAERQATHLLNGYTVDMIRKTKRTPGGLVKNYRMKREE